MQLAKWVLALFQESKVLKIYKGVMEWVEWSKTLWFSCELRFFSFGICAVTFS